MRLSQVPRGSEIKRDYENFFDFFEITDRAEKGLILD